MRTEYTTALCPQCRHPLTERHFTEDLEQVCPDCGYVFDEDEALQPDRLEQIEVALKPIGKAGWEYDRDNPISDIFYLLTEIKRLRQQVEQLTGALRVIR